MTSTQTASERRQEATDSAPLLLPVSSLLTPPSSLSESTATVAAWCDCYACRHGWTTPLEGWKV